MKIHKQLLMPKVKNRNQTGKGIRNGKLSIKSASQSTGQLVEVLTTSCGKTDVLLSKGQLEDSIQQPIMWSEEGILRQALMSTDKKMKCAMVKGKNPEVSEGGNVSSESMSLVTISVTPQQPLFTSVGPSQVIMMSDLGSSPMILSNEPLSTVTWQSTEKKESELSCVSACTVPVVTSRSLGDQHSDILIENKNGNYPTLSSIEVLPALLTKERKIPLKGNPLINAGFNISLPDTGKKGVKNIGKTNKNKRKPNAEKQIELKPTSSLLSSIALDYSIDESKACVTSLEVPGFTSDPSASISEHNTVALANISQCLTSDQHIAAEANDQILYRSNENDNLLHHHVSESTALLTTPTSIQNHVRIINLNTTNPLIQNGVLIQSGTSQDLIDHSGNLMNANGFHRDSTEVILSSDMDHNSEVQTGHSESVYTERLLSQLSTEGTLPTISSSQVSSVLSALISEPNSKTQQSNGIDNLQNCKTEKDSVKNKLESNEDDKDDSGKNRIKVDGEKFNKWELQELNNHTCYRCSSCMFLTLSKETVIEHYDTEHSIEHSELIEKQLAKKCILCIGCENKFYSKHSVQVHLLQDHNVNLDELPALLDVVFVANKLVRSSSGYDIPRASSSFAQSRTPTSKVRIRGLSSPVVEKPQTQILTSPPTANILTVNTPLIQTTEDMPIVTTTTVLQPLTQTDQDVLETTKSTVDKHSPESCFDSQDHLVQVKCLTETKEETDCNENNGEKEDLSKKKRGKSKEDHILKIVSKKVKLDDIKIEVKDNSSLRCGIDGCVVRLTSEANLEFHRQCHRGKTPVVFSCPHCSHTSPHWNSMLIHFWKEHQIDMDLFSCDKCTYKTNSYSKLINEHCKIHGEEKPYLCDSCGKGFKTTKQLRNHKVTHRPRDKIADGVDGSSTVRRNLPCKICNRNFADARILRHHIENVHNKLRRFLCSFCGHAASSRSSLRMHIRQHTGEKPFHCEDCDYTTSDHNSLRRHKMRHSGIFPYKCPHCDYACIQSTTYKTHLKNKHPGLLEGLMFDCDQCSFRTVKKDNFLTHIAEHELGIDPRTKRKKHSQQEDSSEFIVPEISSPWD